jgi:ABC-2 type transport system permease protein
VDRALISLKLAMLRHTTAGLRRVGWVVGGFLVAGTWLGALLAGGDGARHSVLTLAFAAWGIGAALGPVLTTGAGVLRPSYFALLPLPRGVLGRGLLLSTFVSVASGFVLLSFLASAVHAVRLDPSALVVVAVGAPLTWILATCAARLVYGLLGAAMRSRIGIEIAAIQFGLMFAAMFTGWIVVQVAVQSIPRLLRVGIPDPAVTGVLDALPTSWALIGVERAAAGDWAGAGLMLAALAALDVILVLATIWLLVPSAAGTPRRRRRRPRSRRLVAGGGLLPRTQTGAVIEKELRQWRRDAWRSLEVRSAVWTGLAIGFFALASDSYAGLAAFGGLIVASMLGLSALSLYSQDGSAVWLDVVGQDRTSVRSDVRGRQWATLIIFLPHALVVSALFLVLSGQYGSVPILLAALPAALGTAIGAAIVVASVGVSPGVDPRQRVGPNDAVGNVGIHVWVVMALMAIGTLPTAMAIVLSLLVGSLWSTVLAVIVGFANGFGAARLLGRAAIAYLSERMPDLFTRIRYGRVFRETAGRGLVDWFERVTILGEQRLKEQRQKERDARIAKAVPVRDAGALHTSGE